MLYLFLAFLALKFMILHIFYFFLNFFFIFYFLCVNRGQTKYSIENPKKNVRNNEDFATM